MDSMGIDHQPLVQRPALKIIESDEYKVLTPSRSTSGCAGEPSGYTVDDECTKDTPLFKKDPQGKEWGVKGEEQKGMTSKAAKAGTNCSWYLSI